MRSKLNRKGIESGVMGITMGLIILFIVVLCYFIFSLMFGPGKLNAVMQAENAAFTCENNIVKYMNFNVPGRSDLTYNDLLLQAYVSGDYSTFKSETSKLFDKYSYNPWLMQIHNTTGSVTPAFGNPIASSSSLESCTYQLAIPCLSYEDCTLVAELSLEYKKANPNYVGSSA